MYVFFFVCVFVKKGTALFVWWPLFLLLLISWALCLSWPSKPWPNWTIWMWGSLLSGTASLCSHLSVGCRSISLLAGTDTLPLIPSLKQWWTVMPSLKYGGCALPYFTGRRFIEDGSLLLRQCVLAPAPPRLYSSSGYKSSIPLENSGLEMGQRPQIYYRFDWALPDLFSCVLLYPGPI